MTRAAAVLAAAAAVCALAIGCKRPGSRAVPAQHEMPWPDAAPALEEPIPAEADAGVTSDAAADAS